MCTRNLDNLGTFISNMDENNLVVITLNRLVWFALQYETATSNRDRRGASNFGVRFLSVHHVCIRSVSVVIMRNCSGVCLHEYLRDS